MDIKSKKILRGILIIILVIIILLLCWIFLRGSTFSKYKKNVNANSNIEVAEPVFIVDGAKDILIDGIEDTVYNFTVKNYNNSDVSDVELDYYIQFINNSDADLTFELTKDGKNVKLNNNKTDIISLSSLEKQDDVYTLRIKYKNNPAITKDIDGNVQIKIETVQAENE